MASIIAARRVLLLRLARALWIGLLVFAFVLALQWLNLFAGARLATSNILYTTNGSSDSIVIAAIDDASLAQFGRTPAEWDRAIFARLVEQLSGFGARAIAFDLLFSEATPTDALLADALREARQSDARTRIVLPVVGVGYGRSGADESVASLSYPTLLQPTDSLRAAVDYLGAANVIVDADGNIRRQPSYVASPSQQYLSFSLASYLAYLRIPPSIIDQTVIPAAGSVSIVTERQLQVDRNGLWLQNFFGASGASFPIISVVDLLEGRVEATQISDKLVIVGLYDASGAVDTYDAPPNAPGIEMAGVEIQAHAIESLVQNRLLQTQSASAMILSLLLLSLIAALLYEWVRWYLKPIVFVGLVVALVAFASTLFVYNGVVVALFDGLLALALLMLVSIGNDIQEEIRKRQTSDFFLNSLTNIENQRLDVASIGSQLIDTIAPIAHQRAVTVRLDTIDGIFRRTSATTQPEVAARLNAIADKAYGSKLTLKEATIYAVPILWQQRSIGVIAVQISESWLGPRRKVLRELAQRVAPSVENALLFAKTMQQKQIFEAVLYGSPASIAILDQSLALNTVNDAFTRQFDLVSIHKPVSSFTNKGLKPLVGEFTNSFGDHQAPSATHFLEVMAQAGLSDEAGKSLSERFALRADVSQQVEIGKQSYNLYAAYLDETNLWVVVMSDVTVLAELNRLKRQMLMMASHDLRNPLSTILGFSGLLNESDHLSEEDKEFVGYINKGGKTMLSIINEILDFEQLRAAHSMSEVVNLREITEQVIQRHQLDFANKQHEFSADITADLTTALGHTGQLTQVISNLLSNAAKYTPQGGKIALRLYRYGDHHLRLEIEDNGFGISQEAQEKLFTEFYRVRTDATAGIPGTGLGLSLVKSVVEAHHGRIWLESEEEQGSTFFMEFPLHIAEQDAYD